ncbi:aminotransferase class III-fold pyridoxal phosphate-dependent enzyme [Pseudarthrobacter enclensis]|uniref:aminotransferase class III-fold pyridoxal phosphate-dependent enzyme n=1 Tax=Pseudarthrobacter enclensis TaxID=993070 RepID=UPI003EE29D43
MSIDLPAAEPALPLDTIDRAALADMVRRKLAARGSSAPPTAVPVSGAEGYRRHVAPELSRILGALDLDRSYRRGEGLRLTDANGKVCLDFAGAYGALPFGHNDPAMWAAVARVPVDSPPGFIQPSVLEAAGELAARLVAIAPPGLDRVTFANSGAESVEAALKLARSATGRLGILATKGGFHGKTLGALSATGRPDYQVDFGAPAEGFAWVPFDNLDAVRTALAAAPGHFAAVIVEPIQGEGGVVVPAPGYLRGLRQLCDEHGSLLIVDEVQTGLGRTGSLFASADEASPDIVTVAKALGGGLLPIGAVLSRSVVHSESFALRHTSTFAGGTLACRVGLAVLDRLAQPQLLAGVAERSAQLLDGLRDIARRYPAVITDVRGRGLLIGVELSGNLDLTGDQGLLGSLAEGGNLAMAVCSYLLDVEGLRLAPTLFGNTVLRVEPPLTVTADECDVLLAGMERAAAIVAAGDTAALLGHLLGPSAGTALHRPATGTAARTPSRTPEPGRTRFAFVVHPLNPASLADFDPSLSGFTDAQHTELLERFDRASSLLNPAPFVVGSGTVGGETTVHGELIGVPYTAEQLLALPTARACAVISDAVELATERGAEIVGLGAYTSIVTSNAVGLGERNVPVTTGNAFTAAASVRAVLTAATDRGVPLPDATVAIVGAGGAIGRAVAVALAGRVGRLLLVGRPGSRSARLAESVDAVETVLREANAPAGEAWTDTAVETGDDAPAAARRACVVITASSTPHALLTAGDFTQNAIVCDVAQPPNLPATLPRDRPDLATFAGGMVTVPAGSDFDLQYGLPAGITYACMAETMLLALAKESGVEDWQSLASQGEALSQDALDRLGLLADRHGFRLAGIGSRGAANAEPAR